MAGFEYTLYHALHFPALLLVWSVYFLFLNIKQDINKLILLGLLSTLTMYIADSMNNINMAISLIIIGITIPIFVVKKCDGISSYKKVMISVGVLFITIYLLNTLIVSLIMFIIGTINNDMYMLLTGKDEPILYINTPTLVFVPLMFVTALIHKYVFKKFNLSIDSLRWR